jgi:hypothetical protein
MRKGPLAVSVLVPRLAAPYAPLLLPLLLRLAAP